MKDNKFSANVVLWSAVGIQLLSGILYIWSILKDQLVDQYGWTMAQATIPYTLATIFFAVAMFFAGMIQDKKGPRLMTTIGSIMLGVGLILSGFADSVGLMIITFSIIVGCGIGISVVATTPAALKWFPKDKKGMISGLVVGGIAIASIIYAPLITYLTKSFGLKHGFIILGIGVLIIGVVLAQFIKNPPSDFNPDGDVALAVKGEKIKSDVEMNWKEMAKTPTFYKLFVMLAFSSSAGLMIIGHMTKITKVQVGWEGGFILVALIAVFNALGRLFGGLLSDKIGRINLMRMAFLLQAINMMLFVFYTNILLLSIGVMIAGLCYGATFAVFPATTSDYYGMKNFGANYGLIFIAWGFGGVLGPFVASKIYDASHSYNGAYMLATALLLIALCITFTIKNEKKIS